MGLLVIVLCLGMSLSFDLRMLIRCMDTPLVRGLRERRGGGQDGTDLEGLEELRGMKNCLSD